MLRRSSSFVGTSRIFRCRSVRTLGVSLSVILQKSATRLDRGVILPKHRTKMTTLNCTLLLILGFVIFTSMSAVEGLMCEKCANTTGPCTGKSIKCEQQEDCVKITFEAKDGTIGAMRRDCIPEGGRVKPGDCESDSVETPIVGTRIECTCNADNCNGGGSTQPGVTFFIGCITLVAFYQIQ